VTASFPLPLQSQKVARWTVAAEISVRGVPENKPSGFVNGSNASRSIAVYLFLS